MIRTFQMSKHAFRRSAERSISVEIIDLVLGYGHSVEAGNGARKFAFSKQSLKAIRQDFGRELTTALKHYRKVYVVAASGRVITAAFASRPLFH